MYRSEGEQISDEVLRARIRKVLLNMFEDELPSNMSLQSNGVVVAPSGGKKRRKKSAWQEAIAYYGNMELARAHYNKADKTWDKVEADRCPKVNRAKSVARKAGKKRPLTEYQKAVRYYKDVGIARQFYDKETKTFERVPEAIKGAEGSAYLY